MKNSEVKQRLELMQADLNAIIQGIEADAPDTMPDTTVMFSTTDGLNVRTSPVVQPGNLLTQLKKGEKVVVIGEAQGTLHQGSTLWYKIQTSRGVGYVHSAYLTSFSPSLPPASGRYEGRHLVGLYGPGSPAKWAWDAGTYQAFSQGRIEAAKITCPAHEENTIHTLQDMGMKLIVARIFHLFEEGDTLDRVFNEVQPWIVRQYAAGVRYFEVFNEPNLDREGWKSVWQDGAEFATWYNEFVARAAQILPGAKFGLPGLSPGNDLSGTVARMDENRFRLQMERTLDWGKVDWIGFHVYWWNFFAEQPARIVSDFALRYPAYPIIVSEFGNVTPIQSVSRTTKANEYVEFYQQMRDIPNVEAAFCFLASDGEMWVDWIWKGTEIPRIVGNRNF